MLHRIQRSTRAPSNLSHHHLIDTVAEVNAVVAGLAFYPQLFHAIKTHSTAGLSITTVLMVCGTNIVWGMYGIHRKDPAIILCTILVLLAIVPLSIMHVMWR